MDNQQTGINADVLSGGHVNVNTFQENHLDDFSTGFSRGNGNVQEKAVVDAENMNEAGVEKHNVVVDNWDNQGVLGQATLAMPSPGAMPPGADLGVIINENDREREELTGEKVVGTDRPKIQDREGLSAERLGYIEKGIHDRKNDLHALKRFATDEMVAELKGRYGRIFGSEN